MLWLVVLIMDLAVKIRIETTSESYNSINGGFERSRGGLVVFLENMGAH
jgi:hypothetical protein